MAFYFCHQTIIKLRKNYIEYVHCARNRVREREKRKKKLCEYDIWDGEKPLTIEQNTKIFCQLKRKTFNFHSDFIDWSPIYCTVEFRDFQFNKLNQNPNSFRFFHKTKKKNTHENIQPLHFKIKNHGLITKRKYKASKTFSQNYSMKMLQELFEFCLWRKRGREKKLNQKTFLSFLIRIETLVFLNRLRRRRQMYTLVDLLNDMMEWKKNWEKKVTHYNVFCSFIITLIWFEFLNWNIFNCNTYWRTEFKEWPEFFNRL